MRPAGRILGAIERYSAVVSCVIVVVMMVLICFDVISRKIGTSVTGIYELVELLMVVVVFPGLAFTEFQGEHIKMRVFTSRLSKANQALLEAIGLMLTVLITGLLLYSATRGTIQSIQTGETTSGLVLYPVWPAKVVIVFGCVALCLRFVVHMVKSAREFIGLRSVRGNT